MSLDVITLALAKSYADQQGGGGGSIPKPLTYDYMPEGYPTKTVQDTTLMEEQTLAFTLEGDTQYSAYPNKAPEIVVGQTYTVNWDGTEYECVCVVFRSTILSIGNKSIFGTGDDTGEPFLYLSTGAFATLDTSAIHTISVKTTAETIIPMSDEFLPVASEDNYGAIKKSDIVSTYNLPMSVPHDQMLDAIAAFRTGNASIVWGNRKIIHAEYNSSTDTVSIRFSPVPMTLHIYSNVDGFYNNTLGTPRYSNELILSSSTSGSTKKFRITVDDSGTISATEVTE